MSQQKRAGEIFIAACEMPADQRAAYLEEACAGDSDLRREVDSLFEHDDPSSIINSDGFEVTSNRHLDRADRSVQIPESIGRYRIQRELGRGGYGVVCLAVDEQLQRQVAIKIPHRQLVSAKDDA